MNVEYAGQWLLKAKSDLKIAEDELKTAKPATDAVCFHCQQAAEKTFKAFLSFHGIAFENRMILNTCEIFVSQKTILFRNLLLATSVHMP